MIWVDRVLPDPRLQFIPEEISRLNKLEELYVGSNDLKTLPENLALLPKLRLLYLLGNFKLESIPESLKKSTVKMVYFKYDSLFSNLDLNSKSLTTNELKAGLPVQCIIEEQPIPWDKIFAL